MNYRSFVVLYRIESIMSPLDAPFGMLVSADNAGHAEEQCINAYPDADVVWVFDGNNYHAALEDYYTLP